MLQQHTITKYLAPITAGSLLCFAQLVSASSISLLSTPTSSNEVGASLIIGNNITAANISSTLTKISGTNSYEADDSGSASIEIIFSGNLTAEISDSFDLDYDFSFDLTGNGEVTWDITTMVNVGPGFGFSGPSDSGGPVTSAENGNTISGSNSFVVTENVPNLAFDLTLTLNWTGTSDGDTLDFIIPNNSIDLSVVPEPSSVLMLCLGSLILVRRKR